MSVARTILITLLLFIGLSAQPAAAQEARLDLAEYLQSLRAAQAAAERGDRIGLEQIAADITSIDSVQLPGGERLPVDNRWLADNLAGDNPDMAAIAARLGALIDALSYPGDPPPADAQARLDEILSRPPFTRAEPRTPSWLQRLFDWLVEQLSRIAEPVGRAAGTGGDVVSWIFVALGGILVAAVLFVWLRGLRATLTVPPRPRGHAEDDDPQSADESLSLAGQLARAGRYREAMRLLYLSALLWLDERGALRYDRALTNREYLLRTADQPALHTQLHPLIETFDRIWYGAAPIDADGYNAYAERVSALRASVEPGRQTIHR